MTFSSTFFRTFLPELFSKCHHGTYKVVCLILPRSGKSNRVRVCLAPKKFPIKWAISTYTLQNFIIFWILRVAVVLHHQKLPPHPLSEHDLVGSIARLSSACLGHGILNIDWLIPQSVMVIGRVTQSVTSNLEVWPNIALLLLLHLTDTEACSVYLR